MKVTRINAKQLNAMSSTLATGLTGYLYNLGKGRAATKRSPLYKNLDADQVLQNWLNQLKLKLVSSDKPLLEYELSRVSKFGPQGGLDPFSKRISDFKEYFLESRTSQGNIKGTFDHKLLKTSHTSDIAKRLFNKNYLSPVSDLRPLSHDVVLRQLERDKKLITNSGLPDFSRRNISEVKTKALLDAKSHNWPEYPAVLGSRSSRGKQRFIFMYPMSVNIKEATFVQSVLNALRREASYKSQSPFLAWEGFEVVSKSLQYTIDEYYKTHDVNKYQLIFISIDYTAMDQHMLDQPIQYVLEVLKNVFQKQYHSNLSASLTALNYIPILAPGPTLWTGSHGLASGAGWTNTAESILSYGLHQVLTEDVEVVWDQINGDDGAIVISVRKEWVKHTLRTLPSIISRVAARFGMEANPDKQLISTTELTYLQRFMSLSNKSVKRGTLIYPTVQALNAMIYPERFHDPSKWNSRMESLRWIMILENCKDHPLFHDFIDFVIEGDIYKLGLNDTDGFLRKLRSDYKKAKELNNFVPTYNTTYQGRGIEDFETVKYLLSKVKRTEA